MNNWLLYGANGYTGRKIIEEALFRGHRPILAGRSEKKIASLARQYKLNYRCFDLRSHEGICEGLAGIELVLLAAGPFVHTSDAMIRACLDTGTHYLDITGEIPVFEQTFAYDELAREADICLMSGVGFEVVPTDCLGAYVAHRLPDASKLELAFVMGGSPSGGTVRTVAEMLGKGGFIRENGRMKAFPLGKGIQEVCFSNGKKLSVMPIPWGDLETAFHATGIPNIITYMAAPGFPALRGILWTLSKLMRIRPIMKFSQKIMGMLMDGPDESKAGTPAGQIWARVTNPKNDQVEAWLQIAPGYIFTAQASVLCVEKVLESKLAGAFTPSMAFGADFVLEINGSKRFDSLQAEVLI